MFGNTLLEGGWLDVNPGDVPAFINISAIMTASFLTHWLSPFKKVLMNQENCLLMSGTDMTWTDFRMWKMVLGMMLPQFSPDLKGVFLTSGCIHNNAAHELCHQQLIAERTYEVINMAAHRTVEPDWEEIPDV